MDEKHIAEMMTEIDSFISPEVNYLEACAIYMDKHDIDAETFSAVITTQPKLWSHIYEVAIKTKNIKQTKAMLFFG